MTKGELLNLLKDVDDDDMITVVVRDYDPEDDMWWGPDYQTSIDNVVVGDTETYLYVDVGDFS